MAVNLSSSYSKVQLLKGEICGMFNVSQHHFIEEGFIGEYSIYRIP